MGQKRYLIRRKIEGEYSYDQIPNPADQYFAVFRDRSAAVSEVRAYDRAYIRAVNPVEPNPMWIHPWELLSSMPEFALYDWLLEAEVPPPEPARTPATSTNLDREQSRWVGWWEETMIKGQLTPEQQGKVWEAFDKISFHEVVEIEDDIGPEPEPRQETVFAVVLKNWEYGDDWYYGSNEAERLFRTREAAEAEQERLTSDQGRHEHWNGGPYEYVVIELLADPTED